MTKYLLLVTILTWGFASQLSANDEAFPFAIGYIEEGSVANFSELNHTPAGKYGFLEVSEEGDFIFSNGEPIRFFGINIVGSRLFELSHEEMDKEAERLAALGINLVRYHHVGANWVKDPSLYENPNVSQLEFNDEALEKLDYLFAALKRHGIYLISDMLDSSFCPPELIAGEYDDQYNGMKLRLMFDPMVQEYAKEWICAFYLRENRYTGTRLIDDPQLAMLGIVNEIQLLYHNNRQLKYLDQESLDILQDLYDEYCEEHQLAPRAFDPTFAAADSSRFWLDLMREQAAEWEAYLRELGYKGPIAFSNAGLNPFQLRAGQDQDFMDNHQYWGYANWMDGNARLDPEGRWNSLLTEPRDVDYYNKELFIRPALVSSPGKPVISTEHRTAAGSGSNPTEDDLVHAGYRAVGIPFLATIQAFQGWDGFCVYAMHEPEPYNLGRSGRMVKSYDVNYDTTYLGTFPVGSFLLRSGAISQAKETYAYQFDEETLFSRVSEPFHNDALFYVPEQHRILSLYPDMDVDWLPEGTVVKTISEGKDMGLSDIGPIVYADTGEFFRNWVEGYFVVNAALVQGCEGFFNETKSFTLRDTEWTLDSDFGVLFLISCDHQPLGESSRMLLYIGGDCENTPDPTTALINGKLPGKAPVLLDPVEGSLSFVNGRLFSVWALDESGARRESPVATEVTRFDFDTGHDQTIWYEVVAAPSQLSR